MSLTIHTISLGPLETNCYVLVDAERPGECCLIDVGLWPDPLLDFLREQNLTPTHVLLTHGHGDHIGGVHELVEAYPGLKVCCPQGDEEMLDSPEKNLSASFLMGIQAPSADVLLTPSESLSIGTYSLDLLDTSGHTLGGMSFYCAAAQAVFTGDALFFRSVGRTDIPDGNHSNLITNIRTHLMTLPDETLVYPGHGPPSTIADEHIHNPFLR